MSKLTVKKIVSEIKEKTGIDCELFKVDGIYYWGGDAAVNFEEACTHFIRLSDVGLERWVDDFRGNFDSAE